MSEISRKDLLDVAEFLQKAFSVPSGAAQKYALIAVTLSDTQEFEKRLAGVDDWLASIHKQALNDGAFQPEASESAHLNRAPKKEGYNVTSRLLNAAANSLGWGTGGNLVMTGFTHSADFVTIVKKKLMWKDMVASGHGEFTHMVQWLVIYTFMYDEAPALFGQACDYFMEPNKEFNAKQNSRTYLWDFLVDCFPTPPLTDWQAESRSGTARSPTIANALIFKTRFLGERLQQRYARREWVPPSDSKPSYSSTVPHAQKKHLDPEVAPPLRLESEEARDGRERFAAAKGYQGLLTTGYPKPGTENKQGRSGYLFARKDQVLQPGSTLMQIAQRTKLMF